MNTKKKEKKKKNAGTTYRKKTETDRQKELKKIQKEHGKKTKMILIKEQRNHFKKNIEIQKLSF